MLPRCLLPFILILHLAGCASSVFTPYPTRAEGYRQALATGQIGAASAVKASKADRLLALLEQGRLAQLAGDYQASKQAFSAAIDLFDAIAGRATVSLSHTAAQGAALVSNDNAIPYQGAAFERIFLHQFQALNYLALGDREGAQVELRRAQALQDQTREAHHESTGPLTAEALDEYQSRLGVQNALAARVTSSSQNAYAFYLAGVLYESRQQYDDALIDYKRALGIAPDNLVLKQEVYRLADRLKRSEDLKLVRDAARPVASRPGEGSVVVLYEEGFVPAKKELFLPFPWPQAWYVFAIPYYGDDWHTPTPLVIGHSALKAPVTTQPLVDAQALAARALKDELVPLLIRQTLRAQAKHKLQQQVGDQGGALLGVLVAAYNLLSENADLRSWLTLPRFAHIARVTLPEGEQTLMLDGVQPLTVTIHRNQTTLLRVVKVEGRYYLASWPL